VDLLAFAEARGPMAAGRPALRLMLAVFPMVLAVLAMRAMVQILDLVDDIARPLIHSSASCLYR
jgi:hypothetical protein